MTKPYWFKLVEQDQPIEHMPKQHKALFLLVGIAIGVIGSYFLIPPKVVDSPVTQITNQIDPQTTIKNPMLNPSGDEDEDDFDEDDD